MAKGAMHGEGGVHGKRGDVYGEEEACMAKGGSMAWGGMCSRRHAWQGERVAGGMHGRGWHVWQERLPLQRTVRILLEYILAIILMFYYLLIQFLYQLNQQNIASTVNE